MARFMADRQQAAAAAASATTAKACTTGLECVSRALPMCSARRISAPSRAPGCTRNCCKISRQYFPKSGQRDDRRQARDAFSGTELSEPEDAKELAEWATDRTGRRGAGSDADRRHEGQPPGKSLWNAFDERYRPEMRTHGAEPAPQPARYVLEEPPVHDGSPALDGSACAATPRMIPRPCTSARA